MQRLTFLRGIINPDELYAEFTVKGNIPWASRDCNGKLIGCNDPLVELFIAVRKQYRNVVPLTLIPPTRKKKGEIKCIVVGNCTNHQNSADSELRKWFEKAVNRVFDDMEKYLKLWAKRKGEQYTVYYEISAYNSCDEVINSFITDLNLHEAPPYTQSMLMDFLNMAANEEREKIEEYFKVEKERTLALLQ